MTTLAGLARTLRDTLVWLLLVPLLGRGLWRIGAIGRAARLQRFWAKRLAATLRLRIDLEGLEQIDPGEQYVVVPLHEGFADVLALLQLPLRLRFVVRDELATWPLLGGYLRDTEQIAVRPEDGARAFRQIARAAPAIFERGESLVIFPQGAILGIEIRFSRGPFKLAAQLNRPLLPIALTGGHRVWEHPYTPRLRRGQRVSLRVLAPIPATEVQRGGAEQIRHELQQRLKAEALDGSMAPPRRFVPDRDGYWDDYAYAIDPAFPGLAAEIATHRSRRTGEREAPDGGERE